VRRGLLQPLASRAERSLCHLPPRRRAGSPPAGAPAGRRAARCQRRHARRHAPRADDAQLERAARVLPARRDELERVAGVERVPHARGVV